MSEHDRMMGRYLVFKTIGHNEPGHTADNCIPAPHDQTWQEKEGRKPVAEPVPSKPRARFSPRRMG